SAVELAQNLEDSCDLTPRPGLRPAAPAPLEERAEIARSRVFESQTVENPAVVTDEGEGVVDADRPGMPVQQLTEVRLAQPSVHSSARLGADRARHPPRWAEPRREEDLSESAFAEQAVDAVLNPGLGAHDDLRRRQQETGEPGPRPPRQRRRGRRML